MMMAAPVPRSGQIAPNRPSENRLFLGFAPRVLRTHRHAPERQLAQQFVDRALVKPDSKLLRNPQLQIDTAPADHTVPLKVRALRSRYGGFFHTRTRDSAPVAGRYLHGLAQAEESTFAAMAAVKAAARSSSSTSSATVHGATKRWWHRSVKTRTACWSASRRAA
jgi:hypothetical protein